MLEQVGVDVMVGVGVGVTICVGTLVTLEVGVFVGTIVLEGVLVGIDVAAGVGVFVFGFKLKVRVEMSIGNDLSDVSTTCMSDKVRLIVVLSLSVMETDLILKLANSIIPVGELTPGGKVTTITAFPEEFASNFVVLSITSENEGVEVISLVN